MYQIEFIVDETEESIDVLALNEQERDEIIRIGESKNYELISVHRCDVILGLDNFQSYVDSHLFN